MQAQSKGSFPITKRLKELFSGSIRNRLLAMLVVLLLLTFTVTSGFSYVVLRTHTRNQIIGNAENLLYQGSENISNYFRTLENAMLVPYSDSNLYSYLVYDKGRNYMADSYIKLALNTILALDASIDQVHLYSHMQQQNYLIREGSFDKAPGSVEEPAFSSAITLKPPGESSSYGVLLHRTLAPRQVINLHRELRMIPERTYIGAIDIDIDQRYIQSVVERTLTNDGEAACLLDAGGAVLYASRQLAGMQTAEPAWYQNIPADSKSGQFPFTSSDGEAHYALFQRIPLKSGDLLFVKLLSEKQITRVATTVLTFTWVIAALCFAAAAMAMVLISDRFTRPIETLARHMEHIGSGNMESTISINRSDEIGTLYEYFQAMMDNVNRLIYERYQLELENKTNQMLALQAQLNPHFINNTIQSIGTLALKSQNTPVYQLLSEFGDMMHYCMDLSTSAVTLQSELQYVEQYLALQRHRFGDTFLYTIDLPASLHNVNVPKMFVQPLVENCFKHANIQHVGNGFITMQASDLDGRCRLTITDNGIGIDDERFAKLRAQIALGDSGAVLDTGHVGVVNTIRRLRLFYGGDVGIQVSKREKGGFQIEVEFPAKEREK